MTEWLDIHPKNPQSRFLDKAVEALKAQKVIIYPTDTSYAYACMLGSKSAIEKIRFIKGISESHPFTLVCENIKMASEYVFIDNSAFKCVNRYVPGPYCFILPATRALPKHLMQQKRHQIGIRISASSIIQALLERLNEPLISSTVMLEDEPVVVLDELKEKTGLAISKQVEICLDMGELPGGHVTLVDLTEGEPVVLKEGLGSFDE